MALSRCSKWEWARGEMPQGTQRHIHFYQGHGQGKLGLNPLVRFSCTTWAKERTRE